MKTIVKFAGLIGITVGGLIACSDDSSVSGRYVADFQGNGMELDFRDDTNVIFTVTEGGHTEKMDCTYTSGETRISVNCFGSSGISITRAGRDLEADMGGVIVRYTKR